MKIIHITTKPNGYVQTYSEKNYPGLCLNIIANIYRVAYKPTNTNVERILFFASVNEVFRVEITYVD